MASGTLLPSVPCTTPLSKWAARPEHLSPRTSSAGLQQILHVMRSESSVPRLRCQIMGDQDQWIRSWPAVTSSEKGVYLNKVGQVLGSSLQSVRWLQACQLCAAAMVALVHQQHAPVPSGSKWCMVAANHQSGGHCLDNCNRYGQMLCTCPCDNSRGSHLSPGPLPAAVGYQMLPYAMPRPALKPSAGRRWPHDGPCS